MEIDISNFLQETEDYLNKQQESNNNNNNGNSTYPLVYPGARGGELTVRLLWNLKAGNVFRTIARHNRPKESKGGAVPCLRCYGKECPICNAIKDIEDRTGSNLMEFKRKERTLAFAQLIDFNSAYEAGDRKMPQKGSIVLLMFPKSVKDGFSNLIHSMTGDQSKMLLTGNEIKPFKILTAKATSTNMYTVTIDAFGTFKSFQTDQEFENMMKELPNLNEMIIPESVDAELENTINAVAETIIAQNNMGISDMPVQQSVVQPFTPENPTNAGIVTNNVQQAVQEQVNAQAQAQVVQQSTTVMNTAPVQSTTNVQTVNNSGRPECFGNFVMTDKKCILCPHASDCMQLV